MGNKIAFAEKSTLFDVVRFQVICDVISVRVSTVETVACCLEFLFTTSRSDLFLFNHSAKCNREFRVPDFLFLV